MLSRMLALVILVVLANVDGRAADTDAEFQSAKQAFFKEMKKKSAADRADAITAFAEVARTETADTILKRGFSDPDPQVRTATQHGLAKLAENAEVSKFLLDDLKRSLRKAGSEPLVAELFRALAGTEDEDLQTEVIKLLDEYLRTPKGNVLLPMTLIDDFGSQGDAKAARSVTLLARAKPFESKFGYRRCVIQAMTRIRDPLAMDFLIERLPKLEGLVEHDAITYLQQVSKQRFRNDNNGADWKSWWRLARPMFEFPKAKELAQVKPIDNQQLLFYGIPICAKRVLFVLDTSGSMRGEPLEAAKRALNGTIEQLPEAVQFDVLFFDKGVSAWQQQLVPAATNAKQDAIRTVTARGMNIGTASNTALNAAFNLDPEVIYFLSDGEPTDGRPANIISAITTLNRTRRVSIHTIGVVTDRNGSAGLTQFMRPLAEQNYGTFQLVQ